MDIANGYVVTFQLFLLLSQKYHVIFVERKSVSNIQKTNERVTIFFLKNSNLSSHSICEP